MASRRRPPDCIPPSIEQAARLSREQMMIGSSRAGAAELASTRRRRDAPPSVTRGERLVIRDGQAVWEPIRSGYGGDASFIDWINFTVDETAFYWGGSGVPVTDDQVIVEVSARCEALFGFGITMKMDRGQHFYRNSYRLGDGFGLVCYGGQRGTVLIQLTGEGCMNAKAGWEKRLHDFLSNADRARITRIDLAYDDFESKKYSVDRAASDYDAGLFEMRGRPPSYEQRGNWKKPDGKGRTVYIGSRKNGKFARIYEKGKQLGDPESEWVRVELEYKSVDREIPFDVLLVAGEYLSAGYPAFAWINGVQKRIATFRKEARYSYEKMCGWLKKQAGAALWVVAEIEGGLSEFLAKVGKVGEVPKALIGVRSIESGGVPFHRLERVPFAPGRFTQYA